MPHTLFCMQSVPPGVPLPSSRVPLHRACCGLAAAYVHPECIHCPASSLASSVCSLTGIFSWRCDLHAGSDIDAKAAPLPVPEYSIADLPLRVSAAHAVIPWWERMMTPPPRCCCCRRYPSCAWRGSRLLRGQCCRHLLRTLIMLLICSARLYAGARMPPTSRIDQSVRCSFKRRIYPRCMVTGMI